MSARREARSRATVQARIAPRSGVPAVLAAGPCVELWAADGRNAIEAWGNFHAARRRWLEQVGYDVRDRHSWPTVLQRSKSPYSLTRMRAEHPDFAAQFLTSRGLPADWVPTTNGLIRGSQRGSQPGRNRR